MNELILKAILKALLQCDGFPLQEKTLFEQVNISLSAYAVSTAELKEHLQHCKNKGWIDYICSGLTPSPKWFITESGKVVIA